MNWICIGLIAGSLVTSLHDNKEACEGRAVSLREIKAIVKCVEMPSRYNTSTSGLLQLNNGCMIVHSDGTSAC